MQKYPKFDLYKAIIVLLVEDQRHKTIHFEGLSIFTCIPNLKGLPNILSYSIYQRNAPQEKRPMFEGQPLVLVSNKNMYIDIKPYLAFRIDRY